MRLSNTLETYGLIHQLLHWATAILILLLLPIGVYMHELPISTEAEVASKVWLYSLHKTAGMTLLAVAVLRVAWALIQPHPRPLHSGIEVFAAKTVHWVLYGSIILMPVFGWFHHAATEGYAPIWWPYSQNIPFVPESAQVAHYFNVAHRICGLVLVGSLFLHIAGALKHFIVDKDRTLARMVPGAYDVTDTIPNDAGYKHASLLAAFCIVFLGGLATYGLYSFEARSPAKSSGIAVLAKTNAAWVIDPKSSKLEIEITQLDSPVQGSFSQWDANVIFDPDDPASASIEAQVVINSLTLSDVTTRAISDEFLSGTAHPTATFQSKVVRKTEKGFEAEGIFVLAGVSKNLILPFSFEEKDGRAFVTATFEIARLDFGVGKTFADDSSVGRVVKVNISLEAERP